MNLFKKLINIKPYTFIIKSLKSGMFLFAVKCECCLRNGITEWVIPGERCGRCGTKAEKKIDSMPWAGIIIISVTAIVSYFYIFPTGTDNCDIPMPWGIFFQDSGSPMMEGIVELHNYVMYFLVLIQGIVGLSMYAILIAFFAVVIANKYTEHGSSVELLWTLWPAWILVYLSMISFQLLFLIDEVSDVNMTFYAEGHQWYWSYQYPDFIGEDGEFIEFDSYLTPESDLVDGNLRMLDVDEKVIMPDVTHTRFIISSGDVIHSYACPSLGLKADAYPGRLNQASILINRLGSFVGQCSEICGILHSSMPIYIKCLSTEKFFSFLDMKGEA